MNVDLLSSVGAAVEARIWIHKLRFIDLDLGYLMPPSKVKAETTSLFFEIRHECRGPKALVTLWPRESIRLRAGCPQNHR
jgi:hypothetical protein